MNHFGASHDIRKITIADAKAFAPKLLAANAQATYSGHIKKIKKLFNNAVEAELISKNPFNGITAPKQTNEERLVYVSAEDIADKVIPNCPDREWRLIFALARFDGLRVPSEIRRLKWSDVHWDDCMMTIHSPETERYEGKATRQIPIFNLLWPYLRDSFEHAESGEDRVIVLHRGGNLGTMATKIIARAGLVKWEKTFQNLRASCETDLIDVNPMHVACAWIGNTADIAAKHYAMVKQSHIEAANQTARKASKFKSAAPGAALSAAQQSSSAFSTNEKTQKIVFSGQFANGSIPPRGVRTHILIQKHGF